MNIFYLAKDPVEAARYHLDKHVVKMILEYAQLLCTAHRLVDGEQVAGLTKTGRKKSVWVLPDDRNDVLYSATHVNHPSAVWARARACNYEWLYKLFVATCDEYTYRYGKVHVTDAKFRSVLKLHPRNIKKSKDDQWLGPTPAMPDECKVIGDHITSYRRYYIDKKAEMAKWTNREPPDWFIQGLKEKDAYLRISMQELRELFRKDRIHVKERRSNRATVS